MKFFSSFVIVLFIMCAAPRTETNASQSSLIEPQELYASLTSAQRDMLETNGFFAQKSFHAKFGDLYKYLKEQSLPIYVTTDCVLHTYHILYDYSLRILEMNYLYKEVNDLTQALIMRTKELSKGKKGVTKEALLDNLAYFEVAAKLLDDNYTISQSTKDIVNKELTLIMKAQGIEKSPLFGYKEDYSQYKPRGHYTRNEKLQRYFRAMMWFGRMTFHLKPKPSDPENKGGKAETKRALLILEAVQGYFDDWNRVNMPITLYVGKSDDLTPLEYLEIKENIFPDDTPLNIAQSEEKLTRFIEEAMKYRPPEIVSTVVPDTEKPEIVTKGMRLFGQKFIPDSYIFQNLVYDKVGTQIDPRLFPNGLDVFAVLGSGRAKEILIQTYKENRFLNYESQLEKLTDHFAALQEKDWYANLYWAWLYTLKSLALPVPGFKPAYQDKVLQSGLGSWAELRHDTILYAKQSYTMEVTAIRPVPKMVKGYVEPIPECYLRIKKLVSMSITELEKQAFLDATVRQKLEQLSDIVSRLHTIAVKELKQEPLNDEDYVFIHNIGSALNDIESFPGADYTTETDKSAALVADVHTDPNTGQVLEVGNDVPAFLYVLVPVNGNHQLFVGGVYDYYEYKQPLNQRLTDEEWLELSPKPDKPLWIEFFTR